MFKKIKSIFSKSDEPNNKNEDLKNYNRYIEIINSKASDDEKQKMLDEYYQSIDDDYKPEDSASTENIVAIDPQQEDTMRESEKEEKILLTEKHLTVREWLYTLSPVWQEIMKDINLSDEDSDEVLEENFLKIEMLYLDGNPKVKDLSPVAVMKTLKRIKADGCRIRSLEPLKEMNSLEDLHLHNNPIEDFSPLSNLTGLKYLTIGGYDFEKSIRNLDFLSDHHHLEVIEFNNSFVQSLAPLSNCYSLREISCSDSMLLSLDGIENFSELQELDISYSEVSDLSKLAELTQLKKINLAGCKNVSDISALASLDQLEKVDITDTAVTNIESLHGKEYLIELDLSRQATDGLEAFRKSCPDCEVDIHS